MDVEEIDRLKKWASEHNDQMLFADGLEDALIGVAERCGQPSLAVYDCWKCVEVLIKRDGMDPEEAMEFFMFNTLGAWVGINTPLFLWRWEEA